MTAYYNEFEPYAAAWLRNLIDAGHIPYGVVDTRSIVDVRPEDLAGFTQCHFFAGIGGWPLAARLAGWPDDRPLWTGSAPCQPFSVAGKGKAQADDRHLWPHLFRLIRACRPDDFVGEQVAAAVGKNWLDGVFADLEGLDYACGAAVVPACAIDAPHRRDRLWFVAHAECPRGGREVVGRETGRPEAERSPGGSGRPGDGVVGHANQPGASEEREQRGGEHRGVGGDPGACSGLMADGVAGRQGRAFHDGSHQGGDAQPWSGPGSHGGVRLEATIDVAHPDRFGSQPGLDGSSPRHGETVTSDHRRSAWDSGAWLVGHDGKARRVEPGIRLLAHGVPFRVGRLRAYGNAIVPQVASEVIGALMDCYPDYKAVAA